MSKPILCLDFDGVLHSYSSGWQGADVIPDPAVPGAVEFLSRAVDSFSVHIFSSRSHQPNGIDAMKVWLTGQILKEVETYGDAKHLLDQIKWPTEKPPALVTIDDRAVMFTGQWPDIAELLAFKPWNKKPIATDPAA